MGKTEGNPKAKGWLSSIISITFALLLLHAFPVMANWTDKQRAGEGKYDFDEEMCFDISERDDFNTDYAHFTGTGEFYYAYYDTISLAQQGQHNNVTIMDTPINGTKGNYAVTTTTPRVGDTPGTNTARSFIGYGLGFTKKKLIDLDITRIDIYFALPGADPIDIVLSDKISSEEITLATDISLGNKTEITINVNTLLKINTLSDTKDLVLVFRTVPGDFIPPNTFVVFDMQWYCIEEIKAPTLTRLAGWIVLMDVGIIALITIGFPQVQVLGRFDSIGRRLEKI